MTSAMWLDLTLGLGVWKHCAAKYSFNNFNHDKVLVSLQLIKTLSIYSYSGWDEIPHG